MIVLLAYFHYLALALGFTGVFLRGRELRKLLSNPSHGTKYLLLADNLWGVATLLWVITGALRVFGPYAKGQEYYFHNHWFYLKMALFGLVVLLEIYPMLTFIKWRILRKKITAKDFPQIRVLKRINHVEAAITGILPFVAAVMARGRFI